MDIKLKNSGYLLGVGSPVAAGGMGATSLHETNDDMMLKEMFGDFPEKKINFLIEHPIVPSGSGHDFAWPRDIGIDVSTGKARAYLMPKANNAVDLPAVLATSPWLPEPFRIRVALNMVSAIADLHQAGYLRGDCPNSMIDRMATVYEIDLDSLQVSRADAQFVCGVGKPDWLAPELQQLSRDGRLGETPTVAAHDMWSLAVSLWMLFFDGKHPFACQWVGAGDRPKLIPRIERGLWAYSSNARDVQPKRGSRPLSDIDPELAFLFRRTFELGHSNPSARPTPSDWQAVFKRLDAGEDVTLPDPIWQCVVHGGTPSQYKVVPTAIKRKIRGAILTAASLALVSAGAGATIQNIFHGEGNNTRYTSLPHGNSLGMDSSAIFLNPAHPNNKPAENHTNIEPYSGRLLQPPRLWNLAKKGIR